MKHKMMCLTTARKGQADMNNKINWKQKLSSRKFWAAVAGFVTAILIAFQVENGTVEQITAIITAGGVLVAYILGESAVDANRDYSSGEDKSDGVGGSEDNGNGD